MPRGNLNSLTCVGTHHSCAGRVVRIHGDKSSLIRAVVAHFCVGVASPDSISARTAGQKPGNPIVLVQEGSQYLAEFTFDCGPSFDAYRLSYDPAANLLTVRSEMLATNWE